MDRNEVLNIINQLLVEITDYQEIILEDEEIEIIANGLEGFNDVDKYVVETEINNYLLNNGYLYIDEQFIFKKI